MTQAPAIDVQSASAHANKVSASFSEGILIVTSSRIYRSRRVTPHLISGSLGIVPESRANLPQSGKVKVIDYPGASGARLLSDPGPHRLKQANERTSSVFSSHDTPGSGKSAMCRSITGLAAYRVQVRPASRL